MIFSCRLGRLHARALDRARVAVCVIDFFSIRNAFERKRRSRVTLALDDAMNGAYEVRPNARAARIDGERLPDPPGYVPRALGASDGASDHAARASSSSRAASSAPTTTMDGAAVELERSKLRVRRAYAFAQSSVSSIAMMTFMLWMSGNSVQVFSIMVVFGGVAQTTRAILSSRATFDRFVDGDASVDVTVPRLMFCAVQLVGLCLALRKLNVMGLLPTHASDWASGMKPPRALERAFGDVELDL